jgi:hypothetical protein
MSFYLIRFHSFKTLEGIMENTSRWIQTEILVRDDACRGPAFRRSPLNRQHMIYNEYFHICTILPVNVCPKTSSFCGVNGFGDFAFSTVTVEAFKSATLPLATEYARHESIVDISGVFAMGKEPNRCRRGIDNARLSILSTVPRTSKFSRDVWGIF